MPVTNVDIFAQSDATGMTTQTSPFANVLKIAYEKPFYKALNESQGLWALLPKKTTNDEYVRWKIKSGTNTGVEFYEEEDAILAGVQPIAAGPPTSTGQGIYDDFSVRVKLARTTVSISKLILAAKGSAWIDVKADETEGALDALKNGLNDALLRNAFPVAAVSDERRCESIGSIVGDGATTDGTAAARGRADYGSGKKGSDGAAVTRVAGHYFSAVVDAAGGTERALALAQMNKLWANLMKPPRNAETSAIVTSPGLVDSYGDITDGRRRWVAEGGKFGKVDASFGDAIFKGIPIKPLYRFPEVEAGISSQMYFLDLRSWGVYIMKSFQVDDVPVTNDMEQFTFKIYFALVCKMPGQQGLISDLVSTY